MKRVVKVNGDKVVVVDEKNRVFTVNRNDCEFDPYVNDEVEIEEIGGEIFVTKTGHHYAMPGEDRDVAKVNKGVYAISAALGGTFGLHKFYEGDIKSGVIRVAFSWTGIPTLIGLVEAADALTKPADENGDIHLIKKH